MRIFFIPGFGEEVSIFDKIQPFIPGEKVFIDNWTLLAYVPEKNDCFGVCRILNATFSN